MRKVFVKMSEIPLGNKIWDALDFERVASSLGKRGKRFLLKNIQTKINEQEFFSIIVILYKLKIFFKLFVNS